MSFRNQIVHPVTSERSPGGGAYRDQLGALNFALVETMNELERVRAERKELRAELKTLRRHNLYRAAMENSVGIARMSFALFVLSVLMTSPTVSWNALTGYAASPAPPSHEFVSYSRLPTMRTEYMCLTHVSFERQAETRAFMNTLAGRLLVSDLETDYIGPPPPRRL